MVEIKGAAIIDAISAIKIMNGDQAYNDIISQLDEQTRQLFEKPILDIGWYSLASFMKFMESVIKLTENGNEETLIDRAGDVVEKQLKGMYKIFVKLGSPEFVIKRMSVLNLAYLRGISSKTKFDGSNKAIIKYVGFEKQHKLVEPTIIGFYRKVLEISGTKDIHTKSLTSIEDNKGYSELEITWT